MKKLTPAKTTCDEQQRIDAGISAVRECMKRFKDENNKVICYAPTVFIHIQENETFWKVALTGFAPAIGKTLDEALRDLSGNNDPNTLRLRVKAMRDVAARMDVEADEMEKTNGRGNKKNDTGAGSA